MSAADRNNGPAVRENPPPWIVDARRGAKSRLFRYAPRGKNRADGIPLPQESAESRRESFLWLAGVAAAVWIYFWI